ncbi:DUF5063 domain-containing protein [Nonomuraea glycinis]|jgi:hypothetical protein|uniref:DUF5063 domain-containing protein n=1 Tax=Nonomuraea glycinis TaxID=2047744 RepID=A0A918A297_9ACTN|nr:DUF5063 domain-containing protein [Nonomuraea glycinis]MCA2176961.1 DUF5063 domain-containing protein [Nonomuraea glycinis]WSG70480.1 DUF5063 domain-containing protein [Nonomuraea glycinis]GGP02961.1 hypothetical protein GCM10012278_12270 [Nonomuraea glycinis]
MSDEWSTLAEEIAGHAQNYVDGLARVAGGEGGDAIWSLLLVEVAQVSLAGAKLGANQDVILSGNYEPPLGEDPDIDGVRTALGELLEAVDDYAEVFDPYKDTSVTPYRLSDDLTAVAADLIHGLRHYQAGRPHEALWWWQYSYFNTWGNHAGAAMRALQALAAHSRLDVAEEATTA